MYGISLIPLVSSKHGSDKLRHTIIYGNLGCNRQNMDVNNYIRRWYRMS